MHPAHVPLVEEAEPAVERRLRDAGPRRRLLGDRHGRRVVGEDLLVDRLQEVDGLEVLAAPVRVRGPLGPRVVAVEHRRDGVEAEPVDVVRLDPVPRRRQEEVADARLGVVEHVRPPVRVHAHSLVAVLVERRPVKVDEALGVGGEVGRDPVQEHADPALVERVHEVREVLGRAVAERRGEKAGHLVAPRSVVRVLHNGHELDVREPEPLDVVGEGLGDPAVAQALAMRLVLPRPDVDFVDRDGLVQRLRPLAALHPLVVRPVEVERRDDRREPGHLAPAIGRRLEGEGVRVRLVGHVALAGHAELVPGARLGAADERAPQPAAGLFQRVLPRVPVVELADDGDVVGVGRPRREPRPGLVGVGAEAGLGVGHPAAFPAGDVVLGELGHGRDGLVEKGEDHPAQRCEGGVVKMCHPARGASRRKDTVHGGAPGRGGGEEREVRKSESLFSCHPERRAEPGVEGSRRGPPRPERRREQHDVRPFGYAQDRLLRSFDSLRSLRMTMERVGRLGAALREQPAEAGERDGAPSRDGC